MRTAIVDLVIRLARHIVARARHASHYRDMSVDCRQPSEVDHGFGQNVRLSHERRVLVAVVITAVVMVGEIAVGWLSGSMALLADGVHMGTHALALGIALTAYVLARRYALDRRFSFGTGKVQELAGFASAVLLGVSALAIVFEAVQRLLTPQPIAYTEALVAATVGLVANVASYWVLRGAGDHGHHHDHGDEHDHVHDHGHANVHDHNDGHEHGHTEHLDSNMQGAILHVLADTMTSVGAIVALLAGAYAGWAWLDPVVALAAAAVVAAWSVGLVRTTARVLLDYEAPSSVRAAVQRALEADGDTQVIDLHVWAIGPGRNTVVASVVTHSFKQPNDYKQPLERDIGVIHPIIEVQRCVAHGEHAAIAQESAA
jgi:cation diffusion facilitator family transporter